MRVKVVKGFDGRWDDLIGTVGTVISMCDEGVGVEFDKHVNGHDSSAVGDPGKYGYCWNFCGQEDVDYLEPVEELVEENMPEQPKKRYAKILTNGGYPYFGGRFIGKVVEISNACSDTCFELALEDVGKYNYLVPTECIEIFPDHPEWPEKKEQNVQDILRNSFFRVENEEQSKKIQQFLFDNGCEWGGTGVGYYEVDYPTNLGIKVDLEMWRFLKPKKYGLKELRLVESTTYSVEVVPSAQEEEKKSLKKRIKKLRKKLEKLQAQL
jgi:hypothetical protein